MALPILWIISLLAFGLTRLAPGDEVDIRAGHYFSQNTTPISATAAEKIYQKFSHDFGLDLPWFYFTWTTQIYPDTFFKIVHPEKRRVAVALLEKSGNWTGVQRWTEAVSEAINLVENTPDSIGFDEKTTLRKNFQNLCAATDLAEMRAILMENEPFLSKINQSDAPIFQNLAKISTDIFVNQSPFKRWQPAFSWHGTHNQYHQWLINFLAGKGEKSRRDGRSVSARILELLPNTLILNGVSLFLSYGLAVILGLFTAKKSGKLADKLTQTLLFGVWSFPVFWLATLGVIYLTGAGRPFVGIGLGEIDSDASFLARVFDKLPHFFLPVIILTIHNLAYLTRQMRQSLENQITELYIRTARAKGIPEWQVLLKHALPNAIFPLITLFSSILPASIAGSLLIEVIFQIPGMGYLAEQSFYGSDWPVIFTLILIIASVTVVGQILADLIYVWLDPRVRF